MIEKLTNIYSHASGWVATLLALMGTFLGDSKDLVLFILFAAFADFLCGIIRSLKAGKGLLSCRIFDFITKSAVYVGLFLLFVTIDKTLEIGNLWVSRVYTAVIIVSEALSIIANLSIAFPRIRVFGLVKKLIISEVAEKINMDKTDLEEALEEDKQNK